MQHRHSTDRPWQRLVRWNSWFWTLSIYITIVLSCYDAISSQPAVLQSWSGVWLVTLLLGFCTLYHQAFQRTGSHWPMPLRHAIGYFGLQTLLVLALLDYSAGFTGLCVTLLAHVSAVLPLRRWAIPFLPLLAVLGKSWGVYDQARQGDWQNVAWFCFAAGVLVATLLCIHLLFRQGYRMRRLITELEDAHARLARSAAQAEELAALRERTRLARDLHDNLGHALGIIAVKLEVAERLYCHDAARGAAELAATRALARASMAELRSSLANLRTPPPGDTDLARTLSTLAAEASARSQLVITCCADDLPALPAPIADTMWRVAREALTNVERHARAQTAALSLVLQNGVLLLRITDDGVGLSALAQQQPNHYGIVGMRERIEALGGSLTVMTPGHGGTIIEAQVPLAD